MLNMYASGYSELWKSPGTVLRRLRAEMNKMKSEYEIYCERIESFRNHPIILKRGKLFRNWWESFTLHRGMELVCCPICESKLKLICENGHNLTHNEIIELTKQKYQEALDDEEDNKTLAKFKEEMKEAEG